MHPLIRQELENLQIQFGNKAVLTLDDYAALYGISRRYASRHLRQRNIPFSKEGRYLYISILDLATYRARRKAENDKKLLIEPMAPDEMKRRRGFNQLAERRQLGI